MTKAIKKVEKNASVLASYSEEQIDIIKAQVAKGANTMELAYFLTVCKNSNLDPFSRQIYFVKRGGDMTIQTGIDGYRAIADQTGKLAGIEDAIYDEGGQSKFPVKASVTVKKTVGGAVVNFTASARWEEYFPGEKLGFMWKKMPYLMLGKVAEALALRKAFPQNLSGIYNEDEMVQADNKEVSDEVSNGNAEKLKEHKVEKTISKLQKADLLALLKQKGRTEKAMLEHYEIKKTEELDEKQAAALIRSLQSAPDVVEMDEQTPEEKVEAAGIGVDKEESNGAKKMKAAMEKKGKTA